jgi:rhodanese-related sulfurtransferase
MTSSHFSSVLETSPAQPGAAAAHFAARLAYETDPADVHADLAKGRTDFVLIDARSPEDYATGHLPGAVNLPVRRITADAAVDLRRDCVYVTYCWGPGCNGSTKAAARLAALGFRVKEMIGGVEWWLRDGYDLVYPTRG